MTKAYDPRNYPEDWASDSLYPRPQDAEYKSHVDCWHIDEEGIPIRKRPIDWCKWYSREGIWVPAHCLTLKGTIRKEYKERFDG